MSASSDILILAGDIGGTNARLALLAPVNGRLTFVREQMDRSFRDAEDLEVTLGLRVLANIPKAERKAA